MKTKIEKVTGAFRHYNCSHRTIIETRFRSQGLYFGQPPILKYLSEHKDATQKEIAGALQVSPPSIATSLKRMEESGLLTRLENPNDARRNCIRLTEKGERLAAFTDDMFHQVDAVTYNGFTEEEIDTLISFFERMNENLENYIKEDDNV